MSIEKQLTELFEENRLARRDQIVEYEKLLNRLADSEAADKVEVKHENLYCDNVLARTIFIPKGVHAVGEIVKEDTINIVSSGEMLVATEDGVKHIKAPARFVGRGGLKKAGYALEDTVWTTIHKVSSTSMTEEELRTEITSKSYEEYDKLEENKCHSLQQQS